MDKNAQRVARIMGAVNRLARSDAATEFAYQMLARLSENQQLFDGETPYFGEVAFRGIFRGGDLVSIKMMQERNWQVDRP